MPLSELTSDFWIKKYFTFYFRIFFQNREWVFPAKSSPQVQYVLEWAALFKTGLRNFIGFWLDSLLMCRRKKKMKIFNTKIISETGFGTVSASASESRVFFGVRCLKIKKINFCFLRRHMMKVSSENPMKFLRPVLKRVAHSKTSLRTRFRSKISN